MYYPLLTYLFFHNILNLILLKKALCSKQVDWNCTTTFDEKRPWNCCDLQKSFNQPFDSFRVGPSSSFPASATFLRS